MTRGARYRVPADPVAMERVANLLQQPSDSEFRDYDVSFQCTPIERIALKGGSEAAVTA
jgi:hypothetical protein